MSEGKNRHGCLDAYLLLMMIVNLILATAYVFSSDLMSEVPSWVYPVLAAGAVFNLICAIALFRWRKWGFWGFSATAAVAFVVNLLMGIGLVMAVQGLIGVAILFGVLQIGRENKAWPQLD